MMLLALLGRQAVPQLDRYVGSNVLAWVDMLGLAPGSHHGVVVCVVSERP